MATLAETMAHLFMLTKWPRHKADRMPLQLEANVDRLESLFSMNFHTTRSAPLTLSTTSSLPMYLGATTSQPPVPMHAQLLQQADELRGEGVEILEDEDAR